MYQPGEEGSFITAEDLSDKLYHVVKTDTDGNLVLATDPTDAIMGVVHDGGRMLGDTASIQLINGTGTFKVIAGATIDKDDYLTVNSSGRAVPTTTAGDRVFGRAVRAAGAGDVFEYVKYNEKY